MNQIESKWIELNRTDEKKKCRKKYHHVFIFGEWPSQRTAQQQTQLKFHQLSLRIISLQIASTEHVTENDFCLMQVTAKFPAQVPDKRPETSPKGLAAQKL